MAKVKKLQRVKTPHAVKFVHSGSDVFDCALGGGWARGRIANLVGDRSTGKTLCCCELCAVCLKTNLFYPDDKKSKVKVIYDLAEGSLDFDLKEMYDIDRDDIVWKHSNTVEEFDKTFSDELKTLSDDTLLVYILDSLDPLSSHEEQVLDAKQHKKMDNSKTEKVAKQKGTYGVGKAALMNRFFRRNALKVAQKEALLLIVSQTRQNIGVKFGPKKKRSSADALDFYESQEFWLAETEKIKKKPKKDRKEIVTGIRLRARNTKLKVGMPYREAEMAVLLNYGIDNVGSNIDFFYNLIDGWGRLKKQKKGVKQKLNWNGKDFTRNGLIAHVLGNKKRERKLTKRVKELWQEMEEAVAHGRKGKYS